MHRCYSIIIYLIAFTAIGFLGAGLVNAAIRPLLIGNSLLLLLTVARWSTKTDESSDASTRSFYTALNSLSTRFSELRQDASTRRQWSFKALRRLGVLYWIDRGAVFLLLSIVVWLAILVFRGTQQASVSLNVAISLLWGSRLAVRLLWVFRLLQQAGDGSALAGIHRVDEELQSDQTEVAGIDEFQSRLDRIVKLQDLGETESALDEASRLIEMKSQLPGAYGLRGGIFLTAGRYSEAIKDLDRAIELDNQYAQGFYYRGLARTKSGNWVSAKDDLSTSIRLSGGKDSAAYVALGELHFVAGEFDFSLANYEKATALDGNPDALIGRAEVCLETRRVDDAIETCNTLTKSEYRTGYALRGWGKMLLGKHREALEDFDTAIDLSGPGSGYAHYGRAWLLSTCPDDTIRDSQSAMTSATCIEDLGCIEQWRVDHLWGAVHANQDRWGEAVSRQQRAINSAPPWAVEILTEQLAGYHAHKPIRTPHETPGRVLPRFLTILPGRKREGGENGGENGGGSFSILP